MGLIARELEAQGIPTVSLSSAYSITRSVNPPRAVFLDYPLGRTAGRPLDVDEQTEIVRRALRFVEEARIPGSIRVLPHRWTSSDAWKLEVMTAAAAGADERVERHEEPQYQEADDERAAVEAGECTSCVWLGEEASSAADSATTGGP